MASPRLAPPFPCAGFRSTGPAPPAPPPRTKPEAAAAKAAAAQQKKDEAAAKKAAAADAAAAKKAEAEAAAAAKRQAAAEAAAAAAEERAAADAKKASEAAAKQATLEKEAAASAAKLQQEVAARVSVAKEAKAAAAPARSKGPTVFAKLFQRGEGSPRNGGGATAAPAAGVNDAGPRHGSGSSGPEHDFFISHCTKDDSKDVYVKVDAFLSAKDKRIFNPTIHLSHVKEINKEAMQSAVKRSSLVVAALSDGFFESSWCAAEIVAAKEAGIKVIPVYSGDDHGSKQIDRWVDKFKSHPEFGYIFRENARDVLNKQNPGSVKATLEFLASLLG